VRAKTVEIANSMLEMVGYDAERAVDIGRRQALRWAKENGIETGTETGSDDEASKDPASQSETTDAVDHVHVIPRGDDWAVIKENAGREPRKFDDKGDALEAAKANVSDSPAVVLVHDERGRVEQILD